MTLKEHQIFSERVHAMACAMATKEGYAAADSNRPGVFAKQAIRMVTVIDEELEKLRPRSNVDDTD